MLCSGQTSDDLKCSLRLFVDVQLHLFVVLIVDPKLRIPQQINISLKNFFNREGIWPPSQLEWTGGYSASSHLFLHLWLHPGHHHDHLQWDIPVADMACD